MTTIRVAVNGYGVIGKRVADAVRAMPDMELADVADVATNRQVHTAIGHDTPVFAATEQAGAAIRAAEARWLGGWKTCSARATRSWTPRRRGRGHQPRQEPHGQGQSRTARREGTPGHRSSLRRHASYSTALCRATMELHEIVEVVSAPQRGALEVRHVENLREHYAQTLRAWVSNLESSYHEGVALVGERKARVWRRYLRGSAIGFESGDLPVHQSLAVKSESGRSAMPLRRRWDSPNPVRTGPALKATA